MVDQTQTLTRGNPCKTLPTVPRGDIFQWTPSDSLLVPPRSTSDSREPGTGLILDDGNWGPVSPVTGG